MDGKPRVAFLVMLALATTAFAGCIEAASLLNTSDVEVSAFENKRLADEAAAAWSADAVLVSVMGFELTQSEEERIDADPEVGNGLAPAWWYVYCAYDGTTTATVEREGGSWSPERQTASSTMPAVRAFKVTADGVVSSEEEAAAMAAGYDHDMAGDLRDWKVDSVDALAAAKTDESFRKAAEGFNASVVQGVAHHEGATAWFFAAMSADGFVVATVDAVTGELLSAESFDFDITVPTYEWAARDPETWTAEPIHLEGEGAVNSATPPAEYPFTATAPVHGELFVSFWQQLPNDGLEWQILDEEGEAVVYGYASSWNGGGEEAFEIELDEGDYTFTIGYGGWFPTRYVPVPLGGAEYEFSLHLMPGHAGKVDER